MTKRVSEMFVIRASPRIKPRKRVRSVTIYAASSLIRHSSFGFRHFLYLLPNRIQLHQIDITKPLALRSQCILESIESRDEFVGSGLQRAFGIEFAFAREIDDCEKQIADLVFHRLSILRRDRLLRFAQFFFNLRDHLARFAPIEIDPRHFRLRFLRAYQRGQRRGQTIKIMFARFFRALD